VRATLAEIQENALMVSTGTPVNVLLAMLECIVKSILMNAVAIHVLMTVRRYFWAIFNFYF